MELWVKKLNFLGLMAATLIIGCSTGADMAYNYRVHAPECESLSRAMVEARDTNDYKRLKNLNQKYYQTCTGD